MKRIVLFLLVIMLIASMSFVGIGCKEEAAVTEEAVEETAEEAVEETAEEAVEETAEVVTLDFSSYRTEDKEKVDIVNQLFMDQHPNIIVEFNPIKRDEYEAQVLVALEGGVGPDIITMYSYDRGRPPYDAGYVLTLDDWLEAEVPEVLALSDAARLGWTDENGSMYAIPVSGVCHGFYYNKDIFDEYGFEEPEIWSDFVKICDTLKADGIVPIAAGAMDNYLVANHGGMAYGPNFYGGEETRKKLISGELKFTDPPIVAWLTAMDQLTQYYHKGNAGIGYEDSQQMFCSGQSAFFIGGTWEIGTFASIGYDFELGWFPGPLVEEGQKRSFVFCADQGWGINKESEHIEEAKEYLKWVASCEFGGAWAEAIPGFFPFANCEYTVEDPIVDEILQVLNDPDTGLTPRLFDLFLSAQEPGGRSLSYDVAPMIVTGELTPEEAAAYIQEGIETWYEPQQN